jgi:hypothetical protein
MTTADGFELANGQQLLRPLRLDSPSSSARALCKSQLHQAPVVLFLSGALPYASRTNVFDGEYGDVPATEGLESAASGEGFAGRYEQLHRSE